MSLKPTLKNIDVKAIWEDFEKKGKKLESKKAEAVPGKTTPITEEVEVARKEEPKEAEEKKVNKSAEAKTDAKPKASSANKKNNPVKKKSKSA